MNGKTGSVEYKEVLSIRVGRHLRSRGFALASCIGCVMQTLDERDSLGILYMDPGAKPRRYLFGLITRKPRRMFIGTLWFRNSLRAADEGNWVFDIYGEKNTHTIKRLAAEMASVFGVKITSHLMEDRPRPEIFRPDDDD